MKTTLPLAGMIAEILRARCTIDDMPKVAREAGLVIPPPEEGVSKRNRALNALSGKSSKTVAEIAYRLGVRFNDFTLEEAGLTVLEEGAPSITEITRRDVARCFGYDLCGEQNVVDFVRRLFPIDTMGWEFLSTRNLAREIEQHMALNPGDWDVEYLFEQIGALSCSCDRFKRLIESALHPLGRRSQDQQALVDQLNTVLRRDGYILKVDGEESGYPLFRVVTLAHGPTGSPKNLIFASDGPKPEIGFCDAINNDIVVLSNAASCLIYDRPIRRDGLLWSELVDWWRYIDADASNDVAKSLGLRLRASLASDAERNLFDTYFRLYRAKLGPELPALIPQVYLHYDPAVVKLLRHRAALPRQRMDFLLLLSNRQRVVLEVDGSQHFSKDGKPSLEVYAQMASADRDLRLAGYEVYRFGANELVGVGATSRIERFLNRLWIVHGVGAAA